MREEMVLYVGNSLVALNSKLAEGWQINTQYHIGKKVMFLLSRYTETQREQDCVPQAETPVSYNYSSQLIRSR